MTVRLLLALLLLAAASPAVARTCSVTIGADDAMQFDQHEIRLDADCTRVELTLRHDGRMPVTAMGHNWVLVKTADLRAVAVAGARASADDGYLPKDDPRVIAHTPLVGGGGTTTIAFATDTLARGGDYTFFCSFPGHWTVMQGKLVFG